MADTPSTHFTVNKTGQEGGVHERQYRYRHKEVYPLPCECIMNSGNHYQGGGEMRITKIPRKKGGICKCNKSCG